MSPDIDATTVTAPPEKEDACPTYKRTFGRHLVPTFPDHGTGRRRPGQTKLCDGKVISPARAGK